MRQKRFERLLVGALLARRRRNRPAAERINPPCPDVVSIGLGRIGFLERLGLVEIAVGHVHETSGPFVFVGGVNTLERLGYVAGIKPDQGILPHLSPPNGFDTNLIDGALAPLFFLCRLLFGSLGKKAGRNERKESRQQNGHGEIIALLHNKLSHSFSLATSASSCEKKPDVTRPAFFPN